MLSIVVFSSTDLQYQIAEHDPTIRQHGRELMREVGVFVLGEVGRWGIGMDAREHPCPVVY